MNCRFCQHPLSHELIDLVNSPPSNAFLSHDQLNAPETYYPLKLYVCEKCFLVQIDEYKQSSEIFCSDYAYFSSFSSSWLAHARNYVNLIVGKCNLGPDSLVIEVASNDGYLLQYFKEKGIRALGIEPTECTAAAARAKGIETLVEFFNHALGQKLARDHKQADLLIGNNVLAHVPDINDFVKGLKSALASDGTITMEFPHLMQLVDQCQFDTIYHEHFSYFSFVTVQVIFSHHGLEIYDVEEIPTHGGSLRIYAKHAEDTSKTVSGNIQRLRETEMSRGLDSLDYYQDFQEKVDRLKHDLLKFLIEKKAKGETVAAYGAAAKGNTLFNYCGIRQDLVPYVVDLSDHKQGKFLPGSHIPVCSEDRIRQTRPGFVLILPWNIQDEIMSQLDYIRDWGGQFVVSVPRLTVVPASG